MSIHPSESAKKWITDFSALSPSNIDLTRNDHEKLLYDMADSILDPAKGGAPMAEIKSILSETDHEQALALRIALMLAKSKLWVQSIKAPLKVSVVFAVYKEHNRILTPAEHPHGEDFLRKKVNQLMWLFESKPNISWELIVVDDGCPENSGKIAQKIIEENQLQKYARVLFLSDAIEQKLGPAGSIEHTGKSQKGGSIVYGMWDAVQNNNGTEQIVIYTDADLSTHLGQVGLLLEPILESGHKVAIGSRREPDSIVIKEAGRNNRGKLFIYLWKQMIPVLGDIIDTQCGFKAFHAQIVPSIIRDMLEFKFAFDIELLIRATLLETKSIAKVPVAWIDSEAASTTKDLQPYLPMLKAIAKMYSRYLEPDSHADTFAQYLNDLSESEFHSLLEHIPEEIVSREPIDFNTYKGVYVSDLYSG